MTFDDRARLDPSQVQDARGRGRMAGGPAIIGGGGIGLLVLVVSLLLGVNPLEVDPTATTGTGPGTEQTIAECRTGADANTRDDCRIVGFVDSIQQYWAQELPRRGRQYTPAQTVLFSGSVQAGCGIASAAQGPFYCPLDGKVYLDLTFFDELRGRFGARGGPFAEGYVLAHEYGHHLQNQLGLLSDSRRAPGDSIRTELQADCLAGVWARHASSTGYLRPLSDADIASALDAAAAVGDDRIQKQTEGRVTPERWTHGSSEQRQQWFGTGLRTGDMATCDPR